MRKILSVLLSVTIIMSCLGTAGFAADENTAVSDGFYIESLEQYKVYETELASDGYIGIPVDIKTYASGNTTLNSYLIYYVVNTNTERIGTDTDEQILTDLIGRNHLVIVVDYKNNPKATSPGLDWSINTLRLNSSAKSWRGGETVSENREIVVPSGYNITTDEVYFEFDKHGADGSLQRIVDVWNNDFLGVKGSNAITLADGTETTVAEYTASLEGGKVTDITQCIKPDGTPIDLSLRMDIIYPTNPENEVPVMINAASSEMKLSYWKREMGHFVFNGYAGVVFDYPYIPMATLENYKYFDGTYSDAVTGDNNSYSLGVYNGVKAETAAIRKVRHLADSESDKYRFKKDKIGVCGNSKGGLVTRLGNPDVENYPEERFLPGHHGETRFENGDTEDREFTVGENTYIIDGGEEQPWLYYSDGSRIPSNVQFVYSNCGGAVNAVTNGSAPMYITGTMKEPEYYYKAFVDLTNLARIYDVPSMVLHCPETAHEFARGKDLYYGLDVHAMFGELADYWLKDAAVKCAYIDPVNGTENVSATEPVKIKFTGPVSEEEIKKVTVTNNGTGKIINGSWSASFGRTEWDFTPDDMQGGYNYSVYVPKNLKGENGKEIQSAKTASFTAAPELSVKASSVVSADMTISKSADTDMTVVFDESNTSLENSTVTSIRFNVENDAANTILVYSADAETNEEKELLGEVAVAGKGSYDFDVTDYVKALPDGKKAAFVLKAKNNTETKTISHLDFEDDTLLSTSAAGAMFNTYAVREISDEQNSTEGGSQSIKVKYFKARQDVCPWVGNSFNHIAYFANIVKSTGLTKEDYGRRFNISFKAYDTASRQLNVYLTDKSAGSSYPDMIDFNGNNYVYVTEPGEWKTYSFEYAIDDPIYYSGGATGKGIQKKTLYIASSTTGDRTVLDGNSECLNALSPIYIDDIIVTEKITDIKLKEASLVLHPANKQSLSPLSSSHVESGDKADSSFDESESLLVSGRSKTMSVGANKKVYAKVDLSDYYKDFYTLAKIKVTNGGKGKILVYGAKTNNWSEDSINYINAPLNDRYSSKINTDDVYSGEPIAKIDIKGNGEYAINISDYAKYMTGQGYDEATLIFVSDTGSENVILSEDFNDGSASFSWKAGGSPDICKIATDVSADGNGNSFKLAGKKNWNRVKMDILNTASLTTADVGRSFTVSFKAKATKAAAFFTSLLVEDGDNDHYQKKAQTITEVNKWQKFTYDFDITSSMITDSSTAADIPTWLNFQLDKLGDGTNQQSLYIDEIVVTEKGLGNINFEFINDVAAEAANYSKTIDFDELTEWRAKGSLYLPEVNTSYDMLTSGTDSGTKFGLTTDENHTDGGSKSLHLHLNQYYNRFKFFNLFKENLTEANVGEKYTITFWAKASTAGSFKLGFTSAGSKSSYQTSLYKSGTRTFNAADTWQKFSYTFTVTDMMLADYSGYDELKAANESSTTAGPYNPALFSIFSTESLSGNGDTCDMYIDDLKITRVTPDKNESTIYAHKNNMEAGVEGTSGSVRYGSSSTESLKNPSVDGVIAIHNGFDSSSQAVISTADNRTSGGKKSIRVQANKTYNRLWLYDIVDELVAGDKYFVSFWMKADRAGTFNLCMDELYSSDGYYNNRKYYTISEEDVGKWKRYIYEPAISTSTVNGNRCHIRFRPAEFGQLSDGSVTATFYIDDLMSVEITEDTGLVMSVKEAATISDAALDDNSILTVDKIETEDTAYDKVRKAYLHFEGGEHEKAQKATLNIDVISANGQTLNVYGIINSSYPGELTYNTAPGSNADESMNADYIYSGEPIKTLKLESAGIYSIDVTDYVKNIAPDEYLFALTTSDDGGYECLKLDFETFSMTNGVDYVAESDITLTDGAATVSGSKIKILNVFGNDGESVKAGEKYKISVDVTAETDGVYGIALDSRESDVPTGEAVVSEISAGETKTIQLEYTATKEDEENNICAVSIYVDSGDASGFIIDNINAASENTVEISKAAELMIETAKEVEILVSLVDITMAVVGGDSILVNGSDAGANVTKSVVAGSVLALDATGAGEFMYWTDTESNTIVSYDKEFEFTIGTSRSIAAVFADEGEFYITFSSMNNKVLQHGISGVVTVPEDPYVYGYEFAGWYENGNPTSLKAGDIVVAEENIEYQAGYLKKTDSYIVTVNSVALDKTYAYNEKITVTADAESDGKAFSYWAVKDADGNYLPVCYSLEYSFYVSKNIDLTVIYDGEAAVSDVVLVMAAPVVVEDSKIAFFAERNLSDKYTVIETGILMNSTKDVSLDNFKYKAIAKSTANKGQYTVRKKKESTNTENWYAVSYVIYRDEAGMVYTAYSNEVSESI